MPDREWEPSIFVVVPAYNEGKSIKEVLCQILEKFPNVVVIDDGSDDSTARVAANLDVSLLRHLINRGQGAALQTGIDFALSRGADVIVTFDSDGQHVAGEIETLIEPVLRGECEVALGSRFLGKTENMPLLRRLVLKAGVIFTRVVSRVTITDVHNGLRAFSRGAARSISITMDRMAHASEILDQIRAQRLPFKEVPVTIRYTSYSLEKGQSSMNSIRIAVQLLVDKLLK